jgi:serine phosphatase RsbU (regulator of sigma subunit)
MASVRAMLRVLLQRRSQPDAVLSALSRTIATDLESGRFISILMAALDPITHEVTFANAGHAPALHFERSTGRFHELKSGCPPLGFTTSHDVPAGTPFKMEPGDLLVLATDGAIELKNENGEMFGRSRLEATIIENQNKPAEAILDAVRGTITEFHPAPDPPDDVTLLILERKRGA